MLHNNTKVVLVATQMPELIGMVARVMLNFNFKNLALVNPKISNWQVKANATSCGALEIINVEEYHSVKEAVGSDNMIISVSARKRYMNKEHCDVANLGKYFTKLDANLSNLKIVFLFGNERNGLSNEDIALSNMLLHINTNDEFSSLNLSQAVGIVLYELHRFYLQYFRDETITNVNLQNSQLSKVYANSREIDYLLQDLIDKLEVRGYFASNNRKKTTLANIKNIYLKQGLLSSEVKTLMGIHKILTKELK